MMLEIEGKDSWMEIILFEDVEWEGGHKCVGNNFRKRYLKSFSYNIKFNISKMKIPLSYLLCLSFGASLAKIIFSRFTF
jgi:hypothetical protein